MMAKDLLTVLNDLEITAFGGSPFHLQFLAMAGQDRLPHLHWAMSSGDHLRPAVIDELFEKFDNLELHVVYGMAELGGRFCELPPEDVTTKSGSVGFPINGFEFTVRREDKTLCEPDEIGDIYVGGTMGFEGYYRNPDANDKALQDHGFFNGDKGYLDDDGYLFLSGRSDAVFKRAGLKVSAQVINDAMMELSEIRDVFVGSEMHPMEGQVPVAYIQWQNEPVAKSDLIAQLRDRLAVNHIPARFVTLPEIPRTGSGKVDRRQLNRLVDTLQNT
jgi:acyl-coenzyme A synthetase/AMP-(fatty) acid ligase